MPRHDLLAYGLRRMTPDRTARARSLIAGQTFRAFSTPDFWRIWTGSMVWYSARWMDLFVLQWQVLIMTDSAFQVRRSDDETSHKMFR